MVLRFAHASMGRLHLYGGGIPSQRDRAAFSSDSHERGDSGSYAASEAPGLLLPADHCRLADAVRPFPRLYGTKQVTEAYLLGLAMREELVLTTSDRALLHLAGEYKRHVLLLEAR